MEANDFDSDKLNLLKGKLLEDNEDVRYAVAREISRMGKPILDQVIAWTEDTRPQMRDMACYILGQTGDWSAPNTVLVRRYPEAIPALLHALQNDPDADVRASAAHALGFHEAVSTLPMLIQAASDASPEVRYGAACALGSFGESIWEQGGLEIKRTIEKTLLHLMNDPDEDVRDWATFGLHQGDHNTPEALAGLWKALDDPSCDVRGEAADGLAKFDDRSFIPRLAQLLREDDPLSPCYFMAAEKFLDANLLSAVEEAAARWEARMEAGETLHPAIVSALEALRR